MNNFVNGSVERIPVESMDYNKPVFETEASFIENIALFAKTFSSKLKPPFNLQVYRQGNVFLFNVIYNSSNEIVLVQKFGITYNKFKQAEWIKIS